MRTTGRHLALLWLLGLAAPALAESPVPTGFVYLRDVDPSIVQDMRYATNDNFTGHPLPGYRADECVLRRDVAEALKRVQADLIREHLSLKTYDCYRPVRAVQAMARWSRQPDSAPPTKRFFPALEKRTLFAYGYIAAQSAHSTGNAVDLTLIRLPAARAPPYEPHAPYGPCTAPAAQRAPDTGIDMGTGFDCFDARSFTANGAIPAAQKSWRRLLVAAMRKRGFHNYFREWWHYTYGARGPAYDVPIGPRSP